MENLTNEELLDEFDLLEKEIEDETTVTDRRLVILERQKELFAQLRINVRRRPNTQEYENLIDKLVGAAAIVQYDHLPTATLESYRLQATEAEAEILRRLGAAVSASPQPRCLTDEEMREIGRKIGSAVNPESEAVRLLGFFAAAPAQEPDRKMLEAIAEDGLLVTWDKDFKFNFSQVVRLMAEFVIEHPWADAAQEQPVENSPKTATRMRDGKPVEIQNDPDVIYPKHPGPDCGEKDYPRPPKKA